SWGGRQEQQDEMEDGVRNAKNWREEAEKVVKNTVPMDADSPPPSSPVSTTPARTTDADSDEELDAAFDRTRRALMASAVHQDEDWTAEYTRYCKDYPRDVTRHTDLVKWWSKNVERYPTLARIALDVLPVQASSVACERLFSAGKHIATDTRSRLNPEMFEKLQLLKYIWRKGMVDEAKENEMLEEELEADASLFITLAAMDEDDMTWEQQEDAIA
ncbi:hATC-domain-containing protein, partial [Sistotremastrum suecicum HHB10207 ss-3]